MDVNDVEIVESCEKAELLGRFFASIFTKEPEFQLDHDNSGVLDAGPVLAYILFPEPLVERELRNLKEAKSSGPDDLPAKILKKLASEVSKPLAHIYNSSFMYCVVEFINDKSMATGAKACFVDVNCVWPKNAKQLDCLLENNLQLPANTTVNAARVLKDNLILEKAQNLVKKAEETDDLYSSDPNVLGRGYRRNKKVNFNSEQMARNMEQKSAVLNKILKEVQTVAVPPKASQSIYRLPLITEKAFNDFIGLMRRTLDYVSEVV
ncbi:unnamed protein product [Schistocephalus solidus]|uniref:PINc domain-containing protein n=1 Tax=Schistocephalus solidus TaxID=70667 RepID=A0A183T6G5_SCHSO|nr:unnamed protein product [Schistocephalus solidus]